MEVVVLGAWHEGNFVTAVSVRGLEHEDSHPQVRRQNVIAHKEGREHNRNRGENIIHGVEVRGADANCDFRLVVDFVNIVVQPFGMHDAVASEEYCVVEVATHRHLPEEVTQGGEV